MKIIAIGDTHGIAAWKDVIKVETFDKIVFIGDYWDSFDLSYVEQLHNYKDIIEYKEANPNKVILLFGNHDFHYLSEMKECYSGYQHKYAMFIEHELKDALAKGLFQMCFRHENYLFSHAGVTNTWCKNNEIDQENIEESINTKFKEKPKAFAFTAGRYWSNTGDEVCQTPIWVRPSSLRKDHIQGFIQVIGHTRQHKIIIQDKNPLILIDVLSGKNEYLVIEENKATSKTF